MVVPLGLVIEGTSTLGPGTAPGSGAGKPDREDRTTSSFRVRALKEKQADEGGVPDEPDWSAWRHRYFGQDCTSRMMGSMVSSG